MKSRSLMLALSISLLVAGGCQKSEVDTQPAAEVTETSATTETVVTDTAAAPAASSKVVKEKSKIEWVGAKVTRDHKGGFREFDGSISYDAAGKPTGISFEIDLNSIYSDDEKLTGHLKSPDFFDVATYPKATFTSASIADAPAGSADGVTHMVTGTLDLHGTKKDVTIPVKTTVAPDGVHTTSEFTINRHDWGISYKGAADDLIKDNVLIKLDLSFPAPPAGA